MASREGAYDSCSRVVEVDYDGPGGARPGPRPGARGGGLPRRQPPIFRGRRGAAQRVPARSGARRQAGTRASGTCSPRPRSPRRASIGSSTRSPAASRTARRTRSSSSWPATPASSTRSGSACCCPTIPSPERGADPGGRPRCRRRDRRGEREGRPPIRPALLGHRAQPVPAQGPQSAGDRRRLPGRGDPRRPQGPRDPQVDGALVADGRGRPTSWPPAGASPRSEVEPPGAWPVHLRPPPRHAGHHAGRGARGGRRPWPCPATPTSTRMASSPRASSTPTPSRCSPGSPAVFPRMAVARTRRDAMAREVPPSRGVSRPIRRPLQGDEARST